MSQTKPSIVIVEDEPFLASMYSAKFEMEGFVVRRAADGMEGVALIKNDLPDIVLLDVVMPKVDGFEALAQLRADPQTANLPILLLTNLGQSSDIEKGLALGASDYIVKANYTPAQVVAKVKEHLKIYNKRVKRKEKNI
jgi:DNA-binding response OmpR family regulator